jgi:hypothetical protein
MKKIFLSCFIIFFSISFVNSQIKDYFSLELAGSGGLASISYERNFLDKEVVDLHWRLGFSYAPVDKNNGGALVFPVLVHGVIGKNAHKLDVGLGQTLSITTKGRTFVMMPAVLGYRFQPTEKNYFLRLAYTPIISYLVDFQVQHWAGFTYGYHFNRKK